MLKFFKSFFKKTGKITLEDRVQDMQINLRHIKGRMDQLTYFIQKIEKNGLKIKK